MTIDSSPRQAEEQGGQTPVTTIGDGGTGRPNGFPPTRVKSPWLGQSLVTAVIGGIGGYLIGHWIGNVIASGYASVQATGQNDVAISLGLALGVLGWLAGIGALNYPLAKLVGREPVPEIPQAGWARYFKFTMDHKVVGIQYLFGVLTFLFTGGLLAMAIRTELLTPANHVFGPART